MTTLFVIVIVVCTTCSIVASSLNAKLSRVEVMLRELETKPEETDARQAYDAAVQAYNESIARFPGFLVAGLLGFKNIPIESAES